MKTNVAICALLLCIASTIAVGQQVSVNFDHDASFAQYHTYAWGSNNANQIQNSILAQVAQQDINTAMQGKGLQMVQESQSPDLILTANGGMRQQTSHSAGSCFRCCSARSGPWAIPTRRKWSRPSSWARSGRLTSSTT